MVQRLRGRRQATRVPIPARQVHPGIPAPIPRKALAGADPELGETIEELRKLAKKFDMKEIRAYLEPLLEVTS